MVWFSERKELEKQYYEWIKENGIADQPNSVIAFLEINGLLKDEKIHEKAGIVKLKPSNFDKIKAMTVEEFAEFTTTEREYGVAHIPYYKSTDGSDFDTEEEALKHSIEWLQKECE